MKRMVHMFFFPGLSEPSDNTPFDVVSISSSSESLSSDDASTCQPEEEPHQVDEPALSVFSCDGSFDSSVSDQEERASNVTSQEEYLSSPVAQEELTPTVASQEETASHNIPPGTASSGTGDMLQNLWNVATELGNVDFSYQIDTNHYGSLRLSCQWIPPRPLVCVMVLLSLFLSFLITGCNVEGNVMVSTLDPTDHSHTSWADLGVLRIFATSMPQLALLRRRSLFKVMSSEVQQNASRDNVEYCDFEVAVVMGAQELEERVGTNICTDGLELDHANDAHRTHDGNCRICCEAAMRHKQHRRKRCVRVGSIAIDLVPLGHGFDTCLIGVAKSDKGTKRIMCIKIESKDKNHIEAAISRIVLQAGQFWMLSVIQRIHCDKESGVAACDDFLSTRAIRLTMTQGADPQANGEAESAVGEVCRGARKSLLHLPDRAVRRGLWSYAVVHRGFCYFSGFR